MGLNKCKIQKENKKGLCRRVLKRMAAGKGLCALLCGMLATTACTFDSSDNGDFDGYWHLERVDTLATQGILDLSQKRIFWSVQYKLMQCKDVDKEANEGFYFRFAQTADSIIVRNPYKNNWHQDNGDDGGDIPVTELNDTIRSYGINNLQEPFFKEKLKGDKMILRSKLLRLYFTKF